MAAVGVLGQNLPFHRCQQDVVIMSHRNSLQFQDLIQMVVIKKNKRTMKQVSVMERWC